MLLFFFHLKSAMLYSKKCKWNDFKVSFFFAKHYLVLKPQFNNKVYDDHISSFWRFNAFSHHFQGC